jgi:hypothetical protein
MMRRVVALDPGGTTGIAMLTEYPHNDGTFTSDWHFEQIGPQKHHLTLYTLLHAWAEAADEFHLVTESFEYRQNDKTNIVLVSKEYIGIAELVYQELRAENDMRTSRNEVLENVLRFAQQTASQAKGFVSDIQLKRLGLYLPGKQHARDATRHLIYYMVARLNRYDILKPLKPERI